jgi:hypothetical protein
MFTINKSVLDQSAINIREIYASLLKRCMNDDEELFIQDFISRHGLKSFVDESITKIEAITDLINKGFPIDLNEIKTLSYQALKQFNTIIGSLDDLNEKEKIKTLLSKIGRIIQSEISHRSGNNKSEIGQSIAEGMEQAVHVEQYDESDYKQHFPTRDLNIKDSKITIENNKARKEYLEWNEKRAHLGKCIQLLTDEYFCIRSSNNFKNLFNDPYNLSVLKCKANKINLIILLFDRLWTDEIIILKGGKGIWSLLESRFRDFDNNTFPFKFAKRLSKIKSEFPPDAVIFKELEEIMATIRIQP